MATLFFGQFLLKRGLISRTQLLDAVEYQERHNLRLGDYAVKKGFVAAADAARIHAAQTTLDVQFGEAAVELGLLERDELAVLLRAQQDEHVYLGDCMVRLGILSAEAVKTALAQYREDQRGQEGDVLKLPPEVASLAQVAEAWELTRKMLMRLWGTPTKYGVARVGLVEVILPGTSVAVAFGGAVSGSYFIGIPDELTLYVMRRLFGSADVQSRQDRIDLVSELAHAVAGNLAASLGNLGKSVELTPPRLVTSPVRLDGERCVLMPLIAPLNEVVLAVTVPV